MLKFMYTSRVHKIVKLFSPFTNPGGIISCDLEEETEDMIGVLERPCYRKFLYFTIVLRQQHIQIQTNKQVPEFIVCKQHIKMQTKNWSLSVMCL